MKKKEKESGLLGMFITLMIICILFFALGSYIINRNKPKIETEYSNGFTFTKSGNFWYTSIRNPLANQEYNVDFRYTPSEVKNVSVSGNPKLFFKLLEDNNLTAAYFTFDPKSNLTYMNLAAADLSKLLKVINGVTLVASCTSNETEACNTRPIVTCDSAKGKSVVIFVKPSDKPSVSLKENCLTIEGTGNNLVKAYTKLLFLWYNIL